jgi:soluble lytic murein transglycosylase-like protein
MKQNVMVEFKLWSIFMGIGIAVLATEVAVKAQRPGVEATIIPSVEADNQSPVTEETSGDIVKTLPQELVARLLVDSVVQIESGGNAKTVGSRGERGLMQIMRSTWRETTGELYGKSLPFDQAFNPDLNRKIGTAYLSKLHTFVQENRTKWQADERSLLLACYNAGPQRVAAAGFNLRRLPVSTQDYIKRASALHDVYLKENAIKLEPGNTRGVMQIVQIRHTGQS